MLKLWSDFLTYVVHNEMQELEHSLEAIIPFYIAKKAARNYTMLVPYINYETIDGISTFFLKWSQRFLKKDLTYGKDVAVVLTMRCIMVTKVG
jgi:hypothetical protein